jgi:hypothetical protein
MTESWRHFHRIGTVTAAQRHERWSWTNESGATMSARPGDWEVKDPDGTIWSVRDDAFRASYEHVDGDRWRRSGVIRARPAVNGETVNSLEGPTVAAVGDWVVRGTLGEQWVVPADKFVHRYEAVTSTGSETY